MNTFKILCIFCTTSILSAYTCPSKFKNGTYVFENLIQQCSSMLQIEEEDIGKLEDILKNPDEDDLCLSKCILEVLDAVKDDRFDVDSFFVFLEDQAPTFLVPKITETISKCEEVTGIDKFGKEKIPGDDICAGYHLFYSCFLTNTEKLC